MNLEELNIQTTINKVMSNNQDINATLSVNLGMILEINGKETAHECHEHRTMNLDILCEYYDYQDVKLDITVMQNVCLHIP
jgi:hypothetical protein